MEPRKLTEAERDCILKAFEKDIIRRIMQGFFFLWKIPILVVAVIWIYEIFEDIVCGRWDDVLTRCVFYFCATLLSYMVFWYLPELIMEKYDKDYLCIKNGDAVLAQKELLSVREEKVRRRFGGHVNVYFAVFAGEEATYEVKTSAYVYENCKPGDMLYILSYGMDCNKIESVALPGDLQDASESLEAALKCLDAKRRKEMKSAPVWGVLMLLLACFVFDWLAFPGDSFEERSEDMLAYMYEKYGVEFQIDWDMETVTGDYHSWHCSPKGTTEESKKGQAEVRFYVKNREEPYMDSYFLCLVEDVVYERVKAVLDETGVKYEAYVASTGFYDNKYVSAEQFDQFLEERGEHAYGHSWRIFLEDQGSEEANISLSQEMWEALNQAEIGHPYINILCMKKDKFSEADPRTPIGLLSDAYTYRLNGYLK